MRKHKYNRRNYYSKISYLGFYHKKLEAHPLRKYKEGFTKGRNYFYTLACYIGNKNLKLEPEEIAEAKWLDYKNAIKHLDMMRPKKAKLSKMVLNKAMKRIKS